METMMSGVNYLLTNWMTGWMGMLLYWLPLAICVVGYTLRTAENYQKDLVERDKVKNTIKRRKELENDPEELERFNRTIHRESDQYATYYSPTDKIGTLIGRALVSIVPVANLWAGMFDVSPRLFRRLIDRIEKVFDTPLVPAIKEE